MMGKPPEEKRKQSRETAGRGAERAAHSECEEKTVLEEQSSGARQELVLYLPCHCLHTALRLAYCLLLATHTAALCWCAPSVASPAIRCCHQVSIEPAEDRARVSNPYHARSMPKEVRRMFFYLLDGGKSRRSWHGDFFWQTVSN